MPDRDPSVLSAPFDQGVFLLHYNRGREAFQESRYAEARKELENAQKLRPNDHDVLNLLGLVYFKTNAFPEAEVIYRRLVKGNPNVFTLHSNLGLILFKQGKLEEAEPFLQRAIELRPNYAKSHLYLGLLYRQRKKLSQALEHLKFAGADKLVQEVETQIRQLKAGEVRPSTNVITQKVKAVRSSDPDETLRQGYEATGITDESVEDIAQLLIEHFEVDYPSACRDTRTTIELLIDEGVDVLDPEDVARLRVRRAPDGGGQFVVPPEPAHGGAGRE